MTTNNRMPAHIRLFVTLFVDGHPYIKSNHTQPALLDSTPPSPNGGRGSPCHMTKPISQQKRICYTAIYSKEYSYEYYRN